MFERRRAVYSGYPITSPPLRLSTDYLDIYFLHLSHAFTLLDHNKTLHTTIYGTLQFEERNAHIGSLQYNTVDLMKSIGINLN